MAAIPSWGLFRLLQTIKDKPRDLFLDLPITEVKGGDTQPIVSIMIHHGVLSCVVTDYPPLSLATYLAQVRALPKPAIAQYRERAAVSGECLCRILLAEKALPAYEITRHVEDHARMVVTALLPRAFNSWSVRDASTCLRACGARGLDLHALLMNAVAHIEDTSTIQRFVGNYLREGPLHLAQGHEACFTAARIRFHEPRVLFLLRQERFREVQQAAMSDVTSLKVVFALIVAGAVKRGPSPNLTPESALPQDPITQELHRTALDMRSTNHYELLGVTIESTVTEIVEAGRRLRRRFSFARYENSAPITALQYLKEINERIEEAVRILTDPDLRMAYNRTLNAAAPDLVARLQNIFSARKLWEEGLAALHARQTDRALAAFERAQELDPRDPLYSLGIARVRLAAPHSSGAVSDARRRIEEVLTSWPELPEAHVAMAMLLRHEGKREEALEHIRAALRADPDFQEAKRLREAMNAKDPARKMTFKRKPGTLLELIKSKLRGHD